MSNVFEQEHIPPLLPHHHIKLGNAVIDVLNLKPSRYDKEVYNTDTGPKTAQGIGALIEELYLTEAKYGEK